MLPKIKQRIRRTCTKKTLYKRLPILTWLPKYNGQSFLGDLVAGITVGLTVIPQSLAYSNVAGLPAEYGLYGSFLGCFVYILLGSCKDVPVGPTAILSLLTHQAIGDKGPEYAILLCFLCGIVQLVMGFFGLGNRERCLCQTQNYNYCVPGRIFGRFCFWTGIIRIYFRSSPHHCHISSKRYIRYNNDRNNFLRTMDQHFWRNPAYSYLGRSTRYMLHHSSISFEGKIL